jgi:hypothetical protein
MTSKWLSTWPTEPGWYWFYGRLLWKSKPIIELVPVECSWSKAHVLVSSALGGILLPQTTDGVWQLMNVPILPK